MNILLPYPPSDNRYYNIVNNRRVLSVEGKKFKHQVWLNFISSQEFGEAKLEPIVNPISIEFFIYPPDRRKRDILNLAKSLGDALVYARIIQDDSLIHTAKFTKCPIEKNGKVLVRIKNIDFQ